MNPVVNKVFDKIRLRLESADESEPGESGAFNASPISDEGDSYIFDIIDKLEQGYEGDLEIFLDLIWETGDDLAEAGELPPMPEDDSDDEAMAFWMGKAKSLGFESRVLQKAEEESYEPEDE